MTQNSLSKDLLLKIHNLMVKARVTEERLIHIYKQGLGYFWIGGPGEEAFAIPLGLLINKGQGLNHDWLYLHYRSLPTLIAMGLSMKEAFRAMFNKATDTSSGGRNFANHYCIPKWNVPPITSVIENQYSMSIGTAHVLKKAPDNQSLVVVTGGDAGTHEGDFATCLIWSSRPGKELPLLITVQNNAWGISTSYSSQHSEQHISQRGEPFNIKNLSINGNDPEESYLALKEQMAWIRKHRKPVLLEARVSRLYGHSSASGANYMEEECCIKTLEKKLKSEKLLKEKDIKDIWGSYREEAKKVQKEVMEESDPDGNTIWNHIYANNENADWRKF
ncbi:MAG: thiamine pyrophosphate-dependent enzyme [Bdellovibrionales bacterium]|nr:thiamine pyrophosphate-dependent enzyme [Bdellovibrionales bacterium]